MINAMQLGSEVTVLRRGSDGTERLGTGRVIHPRVVQVDQDLSATMWEQPHQADGLVIAEQAGGENIGVEHIRPGLISYREAAAILAAELPEIELLPVQDNLVFLESADRLVAEQCHCESDPWWCKLACFWNCSNC